MGTETRAHQFIDSRLEYWSMSESLNQSHLLGEENDYRSWTILIVNPEITNEK